MPLWEMLSSSPIIRNWIKCLYILGKKQKGKSEFILFSQTKIVLLYFCYDCLSKMDTQ